MMETDQTSLPPLWQVIYDEAVRGHHLLFSVKDVGSFTTPNLQEPHVELSVAQTDTICQMALRLLRCVDLESMRIVIANCDDATRKGMFAIYGRFIESWQTHLKTNLH